MGLLVMRLKNGWNVSSTFYHTIEYLSSLDHSYIGNMKKCQRGCLSICWMIMESIIPRRIFAMYKILLEEHLLNRKRGIALSLVTDDRDTEKKFLFEIVSNARNSVDVDKFDYLARDCYNLGIKSSYDSSRLLKFSRVINDEICFHSKEVYNVYEMFHTR
jgi:HD superfamily phosphohydrolase